jgi:hypothetical protein
MIKLYQNVNMHSYDRLFWQIRVYRMTKIV